MRKFLIIVISMMSFLFIISNAKALTCFLQDDYVSGLNKICIYDCAGSSAAITINSYEFCPLTIEN